MNKVIFALGSLLLVGAIVGLVMLKPNPPTSQTLPVSSPSPQASGSTTYTLADVSKHASATDCWMAISGQVYDLTPYLTSGYHPGGDQMVAGCGQDATDLYQGNTGPHSHSRRADTLLPQYKIGSLQ
jgi:cytochrome b involved in lipid metabolism